MTYIDYRVQIHFDFDLVPKLHWQFPFKGLNLGPTTYEVTTLPISQYSKTAIK